MFRNVPYCPHLRGGPGMVAKTVTREDLYEAVRCRAGLSRSDAESLVAQVLEEITACRGRGEGTFL